MGNSKSVSNWRRRTKEYLVLAFGGKCCICGYNKYIGNLAFHHMEDKDSTISSMISNPSGLEKIIIEIRKCVCLCHLCHGEVHVGITKLPKNIKRFNNAIFQKLRSIYEKSKLIERKPCPICGKEILKSRITCSTKCRIKFREKVDWEKIEIPKLLNQGFSNVKIGELLGVTETTIRKRRKRLNI